MATDFHFPKEQIKMSLRHLSTTKPLELVDEWSSFKNIIYSLYIGLIYLDFKDMSGGKITIKDKNNNS